MRRLFACALVGLSASAMAAAGESGPFLPCGTRVVEREARLQRSLERQLRLIPAAPSDSARRVLLAVGPECTSAVLRRLENLAAVLEYRHDPVGYLRVRIPDAALRRVTDAGDIDAIMIAPTFAQLTAHMPFARFGLAWTESEGVEVELPRQHVRFDVSLPADNPYTSAMGIGAEAFRARYPTYDGRGVTVSVGDEGIDPLMPQLREARDLAGKSKTKVVDSFSVLDSRIADPGSGWVTLGDTVTAVEQTVRYSGIDYVLPHPGRYRIAKFDERSDWAPSITQNDMDRDGNPPGTSGIFGVLWDESTNTIWVDTDRDGDFTNEKPMTDYRERFDVGVFGPYVGAAGASDSLGFAVQTDPSTNAVNLLTGTTHHAASSTTAVGSNYFGGEAGGVAPAASLVAISAGFNYRQPATIESSIYFALEALIRAATHEEVDVIMDYGLGYLDFNDRASLRAIITQRVLEVYRKPLAQAVGNLGPALGTAVTSAGDGLSIGAYTAPATWRANYGLDIRDGGRVRAYSGRGPTADGAPAPSLLAPSGFLAGDVTLDRTKRPPPDGPPYDVPPGYQRFGGTSQATPAAAGAMALLVSGAKQNGVAWDARRIAVALMTSARPLEGYGAHEQGAGLIQVEAAWEVLQRLTDDPPVVLSEAPVRTAWSDSLDTPGRGRGLYEREGWTAGQRESRTVVLERVSGPREPRTYRLAWSQNDGTFTAPSDVTLPLDEPVNVTVAIEPNTTGVHSALLNVIDPETDAVVHHVLHTIVAAEPLDASNRLRARFEGTLALARGQSFFVNVPGGTRELRVTVQSHERPITAGLARPTVGFSGAFPETIDRANTCVERHSDVDDETVAPYEVELVCTASRPDAGVWEAYVLYPAGFDPQPPAAGSDSAHYVVTAEVIP